MTNLILILFTVTESFAVTIRQSPVLADPPVAYYRLGEAPESTIAVDSSANAHSGVYKGTSIWRVLKWNAPFTIEAWVQLIDDYKIDSRIFGQAATVTGDSYGLDSSLWEASLTSSTDLFVLTPFNDDLSEASGSLGKVIVQNYTLAPAPVESPYKVETVFGTSAVTSLLGLALVLFGLAPRGWRSPLKFRGTDRGLSRAGIFQVGVVKLRKRSEAELNSFSARYATIAVPAQAPLAGCAVDWRAAGRCTRH